MAKTKEQKKKEIEKLEQALKKSQGLVLIDYYGLKVKEVNELRKLAKTMGGEYLVTKKTLLRLVLNRIGLDDKFVDKLIGGIGLIFGYQNEVMPAKLAFQFSQEHEKMKISGGLFEKNFITPDEVKILAKLPSREQLLTQLVWTIRGPLVGLVSVCQGNLRKLVYTFNALANKKSS